MKIIASLILFIQSLFAVPSSNNIKGIVLPHHDLAKPIFHSSLLKLKNIQTPSTIVIYGTNHYFSDGPIFTTTKEIQDKYNLKNVFINNDRIAKEHSIQTTSQYLVEYFPESNIIPIIISSQYNTKEIDDVSNFLIEILPKDTLYVASVDFSHNSTVQSGLEKNEESIAAISTFDYQTILNYKDDHMDSPVAIATFMKTMESLGARTWETWESSHGGLITNSPTLNGTSYVVGVFK